MSPTLTDAELDAVLDQVTALSGRPREVEDLPGGLTNQNVKVTTPDGCFVVRRSEPGGMLGIDRDAEHHNTRAAHEAGVGAPVVDYRPDLGVLVIGFLEGRTLENDDFSEPGLIPRVAEACRTLHAGPRFRGDFDMFVRQADYLDTVREEGYWLPEDYLDHAETFARVRAALEAQGCRTVPCNNDLLAANFIDDGTRIWLIDYEYGGNNDPCFELGNLASECHLAPDQVEELVTCYAGRPSPALLARARLQGFVGQYGWTLWGCIQDATSTLDFDFRSWALERYEGAVAGFTGPDLDQLLEQLHDQPDQLDEPDEPDQRGPASGEDPR